MFTPHQIIATYIEDEEKHWNEAGKPENHIYSDLALIRSIYQMKSFRHVDILELADKHLKSWKNIVDHYIDDEKKNWMERGQPKDHIYLDLLTMNERVNRLQRSKV
jgi:hypothetical protein